jgi:PBP1b-binding outer membrane lipoprotein LpoB
MKRFLITLVGLSIVLVLSGCSKDTKVVLKVVLEGEEVQEPASGVKFKLLPYNIETILDSLKTVNNPPEEPPRDELLSLRGEYEDINNEYNSHLEEYRESESSVKKEKNLTSNSYKKAYRRYTEAKAKNKELNEQRENARSNYIAARKAYDRALEEWEEEAYRGTEESFSKVRSERGITEDYLIKTDKDGVGRVVVPGGKWWIHGKERHSGKRYTWLVWNVPIDATGGIMDIVLTQDDAKEWTE